MYQGHHRRNRRGALTPQLRSKGAAGIAGAAMCVAAGVQAVASPGTKEIATQEAASRGATGQADMSSLEPVREARAEAQARSSRATSRPPALLAADALNEATRQAAGHAAAELAAQAEAARVAAEQAAAAEAARKAAEEAARKEAARREAARQEAARQETAKKNSAAADVQPKPTGWVLPVKNYRITATFGQSGSNWSSTHTGLDFAAATGTPVMAANAGTVVSASSAGAYGNRIVIRHDDGTETWYAHLSAFGASAGGQVGAGEQIGRVGSTGNTTGPHLHLEVRVGGSPVDPRAFLAKRGVTP